MSKRRDSRKSKNRGGRGGRRASGPSAAANKLPKDVLQWPIVRAYVPQYEAWMATGMGTAGIIREQPDGWWASAYFFIGLFHGGIENMFGKPDTDAEEEGEFLKGLGDMVPPYVEGDPELAARYIWGAYAWSSQMGYEFPEEQSRPFLGLVPRLSGTRNWWLQQFIDDKTGLVPAGLLKAMLANEMPEDIPEGKEVVIFTEAEFVLADAEEALRRLRKAKPEFQPGGEDDEGAETFVFTREYPRKHWSPLRFLGGRQAIGDVRVTGGKLVTTANVLSMETRLIARLKEILGDAIELKRAAWRGIHDRDPFVETFA
jgi:hypothetical protein